MAEPIALARPYAKAAFEYAHAANELQAWSEMLALAAAVAQQSGMNAYLNSPNFTTQEKAKTFLDVCGDELNGVVQNLVSILAENQRLQLLPEVLHLFELFKANQQKSIDVNVATAFELSSDEQDKLAKALSAKLDREIKVESTVDKTLLGGAIVRAGDMIIDGSVRGRLAKLAEAMNS